ncbi:hypothetical protein GGI21_003145, partial [Coemansia aciculifera]
TTTALSLSDDATGYPMFSAVRFAPTTAILKYLNFGGVILCTSFVIDVVFKLPSLVELTCVVHGLGPDIETVPADDRLNRLRSKYYPLSSNFKKLNILYEADISAETVAYTAMCLVILCPSFTFLDIPPNLRNSFSREVAWAAFNRPFDAYTDSLRHLIYRN